jgi:hypothetical protein
MMALIMSLILSAREASSRRTHRADPAIFDFFLASFAGVTTKLSIHRASF